MMFVRSHFAYAALLVWLCLICVGCGGSENSAQISGKVISKGQTLPSGRVVFTSDSTSCAGDVLDGKYELFNRGEPEIPLAEYTITVFPPADALVYNPDTGQEEPAPNRPDPSLFPKKYQKVGSSDIKFTPVAGDNVFEIDLGK